MLFCVVLPAERQGSESRIGKLVSERIGTELVLPAGRVCRNGRNIPNDAFSNNRAKIVVYINGECISCIDQFARWNEKWEDFTRSGKVSILIFVRTQDEKELERYMADIGFSHPFFIDPKGDLLFENNIPYDKPLLHTFLLDRNNRVVLVGSPLGNPKLESLYKREISRLSD